MRHLKEGKKLGRLTAPRTALARNLMTSLILHERIETTTSKAKFLKPKIERLISIAKKNDLPAKQKLMGELFNKQIVVKKLLSEIGPRYATRVGGYVRIIPKGVRAGDNAPVSIIEFV